MTIVRTDWDDWYVDGDESAVLVDGNVVVLSALATVLVDAVGVEGTCATDLEALLVQTFGEPDDSRADLVTSEAVRSLVEAGVLAEVLDA